MDRLLAGLIRRLAGLLADGRRDWVQALLAEVDDVPARSARLAWLGGGLWLVAREVLMNRIIQVLEHLLKLRLATGTERDYNQRGWRVSIIHQQTAIAQLIDESPSLRPQLAEMVTDGYRAAARAIAAGYDESEIPAQCPFSVNDVIGEEAAG